MYDPHKHLPSPHRGLVCTPRIPTRASASARCAPDGTPTPRRAPRPCRVSVERQRTGRKRVQHNATRPRVRLPAIVVSHLRRRRCRRCGPAAYTRARTIAPTGTKDELRSGVRLAPTPCTKQRRRRVDEAAQTKVGELDERRCQRRKLPSRPSMWGIENVLGEEYIWILGKYISIEF